MKTNYSLDARQALVFSSTDRDVLVQTAAALTNLVPTADQHQFACPVHGCTRNKVRPGEARTTLATHLLADHFITVKSCAAVAERMAQHCTASGRCPFDPEHKPHAAGGWRAHCEQHHLQQIWALALKLQRSYAYDTVPYTVPVKRASKDQQSSVPRTALPSTAPTAAAGWHAWERWHREDQRSKTASGAGQDVLAAARAGTSTKLPHAPRDMRYPCPLGCPAPTMLGYQVHQHVLQDHFDLLLGWLTGSAEGPSQLAAVPPVLGHPLLGQPAGDVLKTLEAAVSAVAAASQPHPIQVAGALAAATAARTHTAAPVGLSPLSPAAAAALSGTAARSATASATTSAPAASPLRPTHVPQVSSSYAAPQQFVPAWYQPATAATAGTGSSLFGDALLPSDNVTWPAGVLTVVSEVSRLAAAVAEMRGAVAETSRRVERTVSLSDMRGLMSVLQPQLQGVATALSDLAASQAATRVAVLSAQDAAGTSLAALPPRLMAVATALKDLAAGQEILLASQAGTGLVPGETVAARAVASQQETAVVTSAARQLQQQLGERSAELIQLANAAAAVAVGPTTHHPITPTMSDVSFMEHADLRQLHSENSQTGSMEGMEAAWVNALLQPRRPPSRPDIYVVASWSLEGFVYKGPKESGSGIAALATTILDACVDILALQHVPGQPLLSALQLALLEADPQGRWEVWLSDNLFVDPPARGSQTVGGALPLAFGVQPGSSTAAVARLGEHRRGLPEEHAAFLWRTGSGSRAVKLWRERAHEAFRVLPCTYGLVESSPVYGVFEVQGQPLLLVSCNLAARNEPSWGGMSSAGALDGTPPPPVPHISRLPLLADAMLLRNPELRSLPGLQVAVLGVTDDTRAHARGAADKAALRSAWQAVGTSPEGWQGVVHGATTLAGQPPHQATNILLRKGELQDGCFARVQPLPSQHPPTPPPSYPSQCMVWFEWRAGPGLYDYPRQLPTLENPDLQLACQVSVATALSAPLTAASTPLDDTVVRVAARAQPYLLQQVQLRAQAQAQMAAHAARGSGGSAAGDVHNASDAPPAFEMAPAAAAQQARHIAGLQYQAAPPQDAAPQLVPLPGMSQASSQTAVFATAAATASAPAMSLEEEILAMEARGSVQMQQQQQQPMSQNLDKQRLLDRLNPMSSLSGSMSLEEEVMQTLLQHSNRPSPRPSPRPSMPGYFVPELACGQAQELASTSPEHGLASQLERGSAAGLQQSYSRNSSMGGAPRPGYQVPNALALAEAFIASPDSISPSAHSPQPGASASQSGFHSPSYRMSATGARTYTPSPALALAEAFISGSFDQENLRDSQETLSPSHSYITPVARPAGETGALLGAEQGQSGLLESPRDMPSSLSTTIPATQPAHATASALGPQQPASTAQSLAAWHSGETQQAGSQLLHPSAGAAENWASAVPKAASRLARVSVPSFVLDQPPDLGPDPAQAPVYTAPASDITLSAPGYASTHDPAVTPASLQPPATSASAAAPAAATPAIAVQSAATVPVTASTRPASGLTQVPALARPGLSDRADVVGRLDGGEEDDSDSSSSAGSLHSDDQGPGPELSSPSFNFRAAASEQGSQQQLASSHASTGQPPGWATAESQTGNSRMGAAGSGNMQVISTAATAATATAATAPSALHVTGVSQDDDTHQRVVGSLQVDESDREDSSSSGSNASTPRLITARNSSVPGAAGFAPERQQKQPPQALQDGNHRQQQQQLPLEVQAVLSRAQAAAGSADAHEALRQQLEQPPPPALQPRAAGLAFAGAASLWGDVVTAQHQFVHAPSHGQLQPPQQGDEVRGEQQQQRAGARVGLMDEGAGHVDDRARAEVQGQLDGPLPEEDSFSSGMGEKETNAAAVQAPRAPPPATSTAFAGTTAQQQATPFSAPALHDRGAGGHASGHGEADGVEAYNPYDADDTDDEFSELMLSLPGLQSLPKPLPELKQTQQAHANMMQHGNQGPAHVGRQPSVPPSEGEGQLEEVVAFVASDASSDDGRQRAQQVAMQTGLVGPGSSSSSSSGAAPAIQHAWRAQAWSGDGRGGAASGTAASQRTASGQPAAAGSSTHQKPPPPSKPSGQTSFEEDFEELMEEFVGPTVKSAQSKPGLVPTRDQPTTSLPPMPAAAATTSVSFGSGRLGAVSGVAAQPVAAAAGSKDEVDTISDLDIDELLDFVG